MTINFNNKWNLGPVQLVLPELPKEFSQIEGILPWNFALDPKIGTETVLLLIDNTSFIYELNQINPFILDLKSGVEITSYGPVGYLLFFIHNPSNPAKPFMSMECCIDPLNPTHLLIWRDLARQTNWHLLLINAKKEVVGFYEFNNIFNLDVRLIQMEMNCKNINGDSFDMAKFEFQSKFSADDLFSMGI
ncbi:MAG: hypothetical protein OEZ51_10265 [Nitrospinota bacterium]|nr:hypothetical protein [Nitrospinota bacterium]